MSTSARQLPGETDRITRAIFEHASLISREQQLEELVRLNAEFARDLAQAQHCSLWLVDEGKGQLWTQVAHGVAPIRIPLGEGAVGRCVGEDKVLLVNDALDGDVSSPHWITGFATQQMLCVPLRVEGQVIGALEVLNKPSGFTEGDAELLGLLAHFAASAVESKRLRQEAIKARMMEHELSLAMDVQQHLLPQEQGCVPGLECVGFCRPAKSVGGDYYDMLPLPSGSFAFTLGDVSGKGIPAAVMMASIQTLLHNLLQREPVEVAAVVSDLNRTLFGCSVPDRYSTLFCGLISPDRRSITYVNAGHVPPLLLRGRRTHHAGRGRHAGGHDSRLGIPAVHRGVAAGRSAGGGFRRHHGGTQPKRRFLDDTGGAVHRPPAPEFADEELARRALRTRRRVGRRRRTI